MSILLLEEKATINKVFNDISVKLKDNSYRIFNYRYSSVAVAMGLGDKNILDVDTVNAFNFTGISHVLVVSGLHVGFIVFVLNKLMKFIPLKKKIKSLSNHIRSRLRTECLSMVTVVLY